MRKGEREREREKRKKNKKCFVLGSFMSDSDRKTEKRKTEVRLRPHKGALNIDYKTMFE